MLCPTPRGTLAAVRASWCCQPGNLKGACVSPNEPMEAFAPEGLETLAIQVNYSYQLPLWVEIAAFSFVIPFGYCANRPSSLLLPQPHTNQYACQSWRCNTWEWRTNERPGLRSPHMCLIPPLTSVVQHSLVMQDIHLHPLPWQQSWLAPP